MTQRHVVRDQLDTEKSPGTIGVHQWLTLKLVTPLIDEAISEARTYWKTLKTYKRQRDTDNRAHYGEPLPVPVQ